MNQTPTRVGVVQSDAPTPEQAAALEWCRDAVAVADRLSPAALAAGAADSSTYDVLWWHADEPPAPDRARAAADAVRTHLDAGGGLLLTLRALSAVDALGVDPVAPDAAGVEAVESAGLLWKAVHADHAAFAGFEDLRVPTLPAGEHPFARYEAVLPERGEVLASSLLDGHDHPAAVAAVAWPAAGADATGAVLGVGAGLRFDVDGPGRAAGTRLAGNLLSVLADGRARELPDRPKTPAQFLRARERLADDPARPAYHLSPPGNWLNDPNGLLHHDGTYHVFYQYNPGGPYHDTIHWGHLASEDLVHWRDEPVALTPSPDGPDRDGCWSGCAVVVDGTPTVLYTGGRDREQLPCLATASDDRLTHWEKDPANPVVEAPPPGVDVLETEHWAAEFRDHSVWREGDTWYQLVGSGVQDVGGTALLYRSDGDLRTWEFVAPLLVGDWPGAGDVWECPELLDFGDRQLLHVSNYDDVVYFVGRADPAAGTFDVERRGLLDHGDLYAPQSMGLPDGRHLTWGWLPEGRTPAAQWDAGWSGVLSLPRRVDVVDGELRQAPARELRALRGEGARRESLALADGEHRALPLAGDAIEVSLSVSPGDADAVDLVVRATPDGDELTRLRYDGDAVELDRSAASDSPAVDADERRLPADDLADPLDLRVFVDRSVVEVFANGRRALASRVYPTRADADRAWLSAVGGDATVETLDVWRLGSVWPAGRT